MFMCKEGRESPGDLNGDDGPGSNPTLGNPAPDGPGDERRSISLRHVTTCATWNIRGMTQGQLNVITHDMNRCGVSILGVSENWMLSQGRCTTDDRFGVYFSGKEEGWRASGVGFVVDKEASKAVLGYNPIDDRVMTLILKAHPMNTTFLHVHAPTTEAYEDKMDVFYNNVQEALDTINSKYIVIMMGDWNAKIGGNRPSNNYIGKCGFGVRNERGDRLADCCASNDLVITNTTFKHHPRRLYTWISPGDRIRNQIDYIMVPKRWQSSIQNVKTRPGADCGSDHQMLVCKLKLNLKSIKRTAAPVRYDVSSIPEEFNVEVSNKFKALLELDEPETTPDGLWESMKGIMKTAADSHMPRRRKLKQQWLSQEAMEIADERRKAKNMQDNDEWRRKDKLLTRKANEDNNIYLEDMWLELERSGSDSRRVFQFLKKITHKRTTLMDVIHDKEGKALHKMTR